MTDALTARREALVLEHMASEGRLDFEATMATFDHPRYELIGTGAVFDGDEAVRRYFKVSREPFPDQDNEIIAIHHAEDAVIVEFWLTGTHKGPLKTATGTVAPTGRAFRVRMAAFFLFPPGGERIVCERVYFDQASILKQLGLA